MTGKELHTKIKSSGVPFKDIAEALGISQQNLQNKFKADNASSRFIEELAKVLGVSVAWFYNENPDLNQMAKLREDIEFYKKLVINLSRSKVM